MVTAAAWQPYRRLPRISAEVLLGGIAAGAVGVCALWWHDTARTLWGWGDWLTAVGRVSGLLAGYTIVVQLLLMGRVPLLERSIGADRLARWHAFGGRYTVSLTTVHVVAITWGYALLGHAGVLHESWSLLATYPDVLMATVAWVLLLGIGAVSARAVRRRVSYETWYWLHFYTYLAIALSFSHEFATGAEFATSLAARVAWSLLYAVVAALLLWYRFVVPIRGYFRHRLHVESVHREVPGVVSVVVSGRRLAELAPEPGQFFRWRFLTRDQWWQSHPYSLSAPVAPGRMRITVKALGDHSHELQRLRPRTRVYAEGPYGAITADLRTRRGVLLLGGGVGITPLRALFETMPAAGGLALLYRADRPEDVLFRRELDTIAQRRGADVRYLVGPPGSPADVLVGGRLRTVVPDVVTRDVFLCGPPGFVAAARAALDRVGVPRDAVHVEQFAF